MKALSFNVMSSKSMSLYPAYSLFKSFSPAMYVTTTKFTVGHFAVLLMKKIILVGDDMITEFRQKKYKIKKFKYSIT